MDWTGMKFIFLEYDELKQVLDGRKKKEAFEVCIQTRKRDFENSGKYECLCGYRTENAFIRKGIRLL